MYYRFTIYSQHQSSYSQIATVIKILSDRVLKYVSVSSYEYGRDGRGCFESADGTVWQTDRYTEYPHHMIFESDDEISEFSFSTGENTYLGYEFAVKEFSLSSSSKLLSYDDENWNEIIRTEIPSVSTDYFHEFTLACRLIMIDGKYYNMKPDKYDVDSDSFFPINKEYEQTINDFFKSNNIRYNELFEYIDIGDKSFRPIDKIDKFNIIKLKYWR